MRALAWLRSLSGTMLRRDRADQALDDELRAYVDLLAADYEKSGMSPADARRAALVATGGVEQVKEATRDAWVGNTLATAQRELTYAVRTLRRAPGFLGIAVATLAIGIGGATAVFTVIKGSLLRPLPGVGEPQELVTVVGIQKGRMIDEFSTPDFHDLRAGTAALSGLAGYNGTSMALGDLGSATRVWVSYTTDNFFSVLRVRPVVGRMYDTTTNAATDGDVVVIGHAVWQTHFAGSPNAVGSTLKLDGRPLTIIGVAPPGFIGAMALHEMDVWIPTERLANKPSNPLSGAIDHTSRRDAWMWLVGRVAPGKTIDDAQRELAAAAGANPAINAERTIQVFPGSGMTPGERADVARVPRLLALAVALLLLIACGNVAGLFLVRSSARRRELATRLALGASRVALVRQVALEGGLIALGSAVLGIVLARILVGSATLVSTLIDMDSLDLAMDRRVLAVAVLAAALTAILVSLAPALQIFRVSPSAVLKDGGGAGRRRKTQSALVAGQVAASLVLLFAATLIFTAFQRVLATHESFDPGTLTDVGIEMRAVKLDTTQRLAFYNDLMARVSALPGVQGFALASTLLPFQWSAGARVYRRGEEPPPGPRPIDEMDAALRATPVNISPTYFETMRISLLEGRGFDSGDRVGTTPVVVVSRALGEALWPGQNPIGRFVAWPPLQGPARDPLLVVGVAQDVTRISVYGPPVPVMYLPFTQQPGSNLTLVVRGTRRAGVDVATLRRVVSGIDSRIAPLGGRTLASRINDVVRPQRASSAWLATFGVISLLLAGIGVYGVVAQGVLQRTRELAVRCALGASPRRILGSVLGDGMRLAIVGVVLGGGACVVALRVVQSTFASVTGVNYQLAAAAVAVLGGAMVIATYLPARRAARLNPADVLRSD